jgi:serine protease Do
MVDEPTERGFGPPDFAGCNACSIIFAPSAYNCNDGASSRILPLEEFPLMRSLLMPVATLLVGTLFGALLTGSFLQGGPSAAPAIPKEMTSYRDIVKKILPAVVSIEAKAKPSKVKPPVRKSAFADDFHRAADKDDDSLGFGCGCIIDPKGVIVTNYHVVEDADLLEVTLSDGRKFATKDFVSDPKTDLAVVRIQAKADLPSLQLGDSNEMEIGDRVLAAGAPFGLSGSVSAGIVSGKKRSLHVNTVEDFLQTDAAINPGNSGGPLVNLEGKVIGITSAIKSRNGGFEGVGLAISSNLVADIVNQLLKDGVVRRGYLGVKVKDVDTEEMAQRLGLKKPRGVQVTRVFEDGPAARAEIAKGDVIVDLACKSIKDTAELQSVVAGLPLGKPAAVTIVRDGKTRTIEVVVGLEPRETAPSGK